MNDTILRKHLELSEGRRAKPYTDTVGKTTIGIGRNLSDVGLRPDEIELLYRNDVIAAKALLDANLPWWRDLDEVRQIVLVEMAFNLGSKLLAFNNTLSAVKARQWDAAAAGMRRSIWASQVKGRAERLAKMMETGVDPLA